MARCPIIPLPPFHYGLVVFPKKCRLFCTQAHAQCRVHFFHHLKFYFRFRQLIGLPVWGQFCCGCKGEESSTFFSGNIQYTFQYYMSPFCGSSSFFRWSSFYRSSSFFRSSSFLACLHFLGHLPFSSCLHFIGRLHFLGHFHFLGRLNFLGHLHFLGRLHFCTVTVTERTTLVKVNQAILLGR